MDVSISEGGRSNICRRTRKFEHDATVQLTTPLFSYMSGVACPNAAVMLATS